VSATRPEGITAGGQLALFSAFKIGLIRPINKARCGTALFPDANNNSLPMPNRPPECPKRSKPPFICKERPARISKQL